MSKNRLNITLNLDMGKAGNPENPKPDQSVLIRELRSIRKDLSGLSKKQKKSQSNPVKHKVRIVERVIEKVKRRPDSTNSVLVSELRGLRKQISTLPHSAHAGGG